MSAVHKLKVSRVPAGIAGLVLGGVLLAGSSASIVAAAEGGENAIPAATCVDLSGEYENRASAGSRSDFYLSNLLGLSPGVTRIVLTGEEAGLVLKAHLYNSGIEQMFFSWSEFNCMDSARVYRYTKSNQALSPYEGKPVGGSVDRQLAMEKANDGSLLVRYSWSQSWIAPVWWGFWPQNFKGEDWARFQPYKK